MENADAISLVGILFVSALCERKKGKKLPSRVVTRGRFQRFVR